MLCVTNKTKQKPLITKADFLIIKDKILGKKYELSLVFIGDAKSKKLNKEYRNKKYIPNILSFPIEDKKEGEIFINLKQINKEYKKTEFSKKNYQAFIFIHGCLHLKDYEHGEEMEKLENKFIKKFIK